MYKKEKNDKKQKVVKKELTQQQKIFVNIRQRAQIHSIVVFVF